MLTDVFRPRLLTVEYNPRHALNMSTANACARPDLHYLQNESGFYAGGSGGIGSYRFGGADASSLAALHKAAQRSVVPRV